MKKLTPATVFYALILNLFPFSNSFAQKDIKETLLQDIVKVENGLFSIREFGILGTFDKEYEVEITATAPQNLLSRDNFLRFYGAFSSSIFSTYLSQEGTKAPDDLHIILRDKPGDRIDLTVTISMSEKGVDYILETQNSTSKMNIQWLTQLYLTPPAN